MQLTDRENEKKPKTIPFTHLPIKDALNYLMGKNKISLICLADTTWYIK